MRRVRIALRLYDFSFEHRLRSVFGDAARVSALNPLGSVPILVLDDGEVLADSATILDHLNEQAGEAALMPQSGPERRAALKLVTLATGLAERTVSLFYARHFVDVTAPALTDRLQAQIGNTLSALEAERRRMPSLWFHVKTLGHADIALACALRHMGAAAPDLWDPGGHPGLAAHAAAAEALPVFREISLPFVGPSGA